MSDYENPFERGPSEYDAKLEQLRRYVYEPEDEWGEYCDGIMRLVYSLVTIARWDEQFENITMPEHHELTQSYCERLVRYRSERLSELREIISRLP